MSDAVLWSQFVEDLQNLRVMEEKIRLGKKLLSDPKMRRVIEKQTSDDLQRTYHFSPSEARRAARVVTEEILKYKFRK